VYDKIKFLAILTCFSWLILSGLASQTLAGTSTKSFDFGAGGDNPTFRSHSRSFLVPQAVAIALKINYRTSGESPISITVELENSENRIVASQDALAEKSLKQIIINIRAAENTVFGCEKGWLVRIKSKDGQIPPARVFGDISLSFIDPPTVRLLLEGQNFDLKKNSELSRQIGNQETFRHTGIVNIKSSWTHNPLAQALPLKFELVRPDGSVAKSLVGYGTNSNAQPKIDFDYRFIVADTKQNGVWRLRVTNNTDQEIFEIAPSAVFTKRCFE
jgi:hypothetical protein